MRFVVTGEWTRNDLLRIIVLCFLAYTFILWVTNAGMYFSRMTLAPQSVVDYYLGNEQRFQQPRSLQGLIETLHFHSFAMGMLLMTLTHLLLFVPLPYRTKAWGIGLSFLSGFVSEASGWAVRFLHPGFAVAKVGSFLLLEGVLLWLMISVGAALVRRKPSDYSSAPRPLT